MLHLSAIITVVALTVSVVAYLLWQFGSFLLLLLAVGARVRTLEDFLAVILILCAILLVCGDYVCFGIVSTLLNKQVDPRLAVYIHIIPHLVFCVVFGLRILFLLNRDRKPTSTAWAVATPKAPLTAFWIVGMVDVGDYLLRAFAPGFLTWAPIMSRAFWVLCALLAVVTWLFASAAYRLSVRSALTSKKEVRHAGM